MSMFVGLVLALRLITASAPVQEPSAPPQVPAKTTANVDGRGAVIEAPTTPLVVSENDQRLVVAQRLRIDGLLEAQRVLQKEVDSSLVELQRLIQRLAAAAPPGMELSPQLTYVKKPEPKKDEKK